METQATLTKVPLRPNLYQSAINQDRKASGGLWSSTHTSEGSAWIEWCRAEQFRRGTYHLWLLEPDPDTRICVIDSHRDLRALKARAGRIRTGGIEPSIEVDYEKLSEDFDAVWLTEAGRRDIYNSEDFMFAADWSCESTAWLRWKFQARDAGLITI